MPSIEITKSIKAPAEKVFTTIAHIQEFSQVVPSIVRVEIISDVEKGAKVTRSPPPR